MLGLSGVQHNVFLRDYTLALSGILETLATSTSDGHRGVVKVEQ